jgi:hypothetical protein
MDFHERLEHEFIEMISAAGIPAPDDTARMQRALIFLWYDTKAFVLIDLDDMPADDPFAGFDVERLRDDVLGGLEPMSELRPGVPPFFAEAG